MRSLRVPDLYRNADAGHLGLVPIDVERHALPESANGVGRSFIDVRPRAGLAVINPAQRNATIDRSATSRVQGIVTTLPVADRRTLDARQAQAKNQ